MNMLICVMQQWVRSQFDRSIKVFRLDNGKEYVKSDVKKFLVEKGIQVSNSSPYTPEECERVNRTIM